MDGTYIIGEGDSKPVVIIFDTTADKQKVFDAKKVLKNYRGTYGIKIFINEYLPQQTNEQRREQQIISDIKSDPNSTVKTEYTSKGLKIGTEHYRKKVVAPKPGDLLELSSEDLDQTLAMKTTQGGRVRIQDSAFIAYGIDTKDYQSIRKAYLKVRLMHAQARHVVCAYNIPGAEKYYTQDFVDDEELGAGRIILESMIANNIECKAVFVVHFCGREKLGSKRFGGYLEAVNNLLKEHPFNSVQKRQQLFNINYAKPGKSTQRKEPTHSPSSVEPRLDQQRTRSIRGARGAWSKGRGGHW